MIGIQWLELKGIKKAAVIALFAIHLITTSGTFLMLEILFMWPSFVEDYYEFLKTLGTVIYHCICLLRTFHWIFIQRNAKEMTEILERESFATLAYDSEEKEKCKQFVEKSRNESFFIYYFINICGFLSLVFSNVYSLLTPVEVYEYAQNKTIFKRVPPYSSIGVTNSNSNQALTLKFMYDFYSMVYCNICLFGRYRYIINTYTAKNTWTICYSM